MKRAVLVLTIVVFALVTVIPAFAMSQDFHGVIMPNTVERKGIIEIDVAAVDYFDDTAAPEEGIIAILRQSVLTMRKAGGDQQEY
jgi:hypothetical protein